MVWLWMFAFCGNLAHELLAMEFFCHNNKKELKKIASDKIKIYCLQEPSGSSWRAAPAHPCHSWVCSTTWFNVFYPKEAIATKQNLKKKHLTRFRCSAFKGLSEAVDKQLQHTSVIAEYVLQPDSMLFYP